MCNFGSVSNTTINVNGGSFFYSSSSFAPYPPGVFGFGYPPIGNDAFLFGAGAGLGMAAGLAMPAIFKGIGKGCSWLWNNALQPAFGFLGKGASFLWNKAIVPAAKGVWSGIKWIGNGIGNVACAIGRGIKNLWNKIF